MKKRNVLVTTVTLFVLLISGSAWAQYPQLTSEAGQAYQKMRKELYAHSDSAWAVAYPIVMKEAQNGRPYVPWASRPYDLPQAKFPLSQVLKEEVCIRLEDVVVRLSL